MAAAAAENQLGEDEEQYGRHGDDANDLADEETCVHAEVSVNHRDCLLVLLAAEYQPVYNAATVHCEGGWFLRNTRVLRAICSGFHVTLKTSLSSQNNNSSVSPSWAETETSKANKATLSKQSINAPIGEDGNEATKQYCVTYKYYITYICVYFHKTPENRLKGLRFLQLFCRVCTHLSVVFFPGFVKQPCSSCRKS